MRERSATRPRSTWTARTTRARRPVMHAQAGDLKNIREIIDKARVRAAQEEKDRAEGRGSAGDAPGRSSRRRSLKGLSSKRSKNRRSRRSSGSIDEAAA